MQLGKRPSSHPQAIQRRPVFVCIKGHRLPTYTSGPRKPVPPPSRAARASCRQKTGGPPTSSSHACRRAPVREGTNQAGPLGRRREEQVCRMHCSLASDPRRWPAAAPVLSCTSFAHGHALPTGPTRHTAVASALRSSDAEPVRAAYHQLKIRTTFGQWT